MTSAKNQAEENQPMLPAVRAFNSLNGKDQLAALALIYKEVGSSIPADAIGAASSQVSGLVTQIEQMPQDRLLDSLEDIITAGKNDQGEVVLDPNPSKALTELVTGGGVTVPTDQYSAMDPQTKLGFWYQIAQKLGSSIPAIPSDFSPSSEVTDLLDLLKSLDDEQRLSFLKRVA